MLGAFSPSYTKSPTMPDVIPVGKSALSTIERKIKEQKAKIDAVYIYINRLAASVIFVVNESGKKIAYVETAIPKPDVYLYLDRETKKASYKAKNPKAFFEFALNADGDFVVLDEVLASKDFGFEKLNRFVKEAFMPLSNWDARYFPVELWDDVVRAVLIEKGGQRIRGASDQDAELLELPREGEPLVIAVTSKDSKYLVAEKKNIPFKVISFSFGFDEKKVEAVSITDTVEKIIRDNAKAGIYPLSMIPDFKAIDLETSKIATIKGVDRKPLEKWVKDLKKDKAVTVARFIEYLWKYGDVNVPYAIDFVKLSDIKEIEATRLYALLELLSTLDIYSELFGVIEDRSWQALGETYVRVEDMLNSAASTLRKQFRDLRYLIAEKIAESYGYRDAATIKMVAEALVASQRRRLSHYARKKLADMVLRIAREKNFNEQIIAGQQLVSLISDLLKPVLELLNYFVEDKFQVEEREITKSFAGSERNFTVVLALRNKEVGFVAPIEYKELIGFGEKLLRDILAGIGNFEGLEANEINDYFGKIEGILNKFKETFGEPAIVDIVTPESIANVALFTEERPHSPIYTLVAGVGLTKKEARKKRIEELSSIYRRFVTSLVISGEAGTLFGDKEPFFKAGFFLFNLANSYYYAKYRNRLAKVVQTLREKIGIKKKEEKEQLITEEAVESLEVESKPEEKTVRELLEEPAEQETQKIDKELEQEIEEGVKESEEAIKQEIAQATLKELEFDYVTTEYYDEEAARLLPVYEARAEELGSIERLLTFYNAYGNKLNRLPVILDNFLMLTKANQLIKQVVREKFGDDALEVPANEAPELWDEIINRAGAIDSRLRSFLEYMLVGSFSWIFREIANLDESIAKVFEAAGRKGKEEINIFLRELFIVSSPFVKSAVINGIYNLGRYLKGLGYSFRKEIFIEPFSNEWIATLYEFSSNQNKSFWGLRPQVRKLIRDTARRLKLSEERESYILIPNEEKTQTLEKQAVLEFESKVPEKIRVNASRQVNKVSRLMANFIFAVTYLSTVASETNEKVNQVRNKFKDTEFQRKLLRASILMSLTSYFSGGIEGRNVVFGFGALEGNDLKVIELFGGKRRKEVGELSRILHKVLTGEVLDTIYANILRDITEGVKPEKIAEQEFLKKGGFFDAIEALDKFYQELVNEKGEKVIYRLVKSGDTETLVAIPIDDILQGLSEVDTSELNTVVEKSLTQASPKIQVFFNLMRLTREFAKGKTVDLSGLVVGEGKGKHQTGILKFLQEVTLYNIYDVLKSYGRYYYRLNAYFDLNSPTAELRLIELFNKMITAPSRRSESNITALEVRELDITVPTFNSILATQPETTQIELKKLGIRASIRVVPNTAIYEYLLGVSDIDRFKIMETPITGFPNLIPFFAAYVDRIGLSKLAEIRKTKAVSPVEALQRIDATFVKAFYETVKESVPEVQPQELKARTKEIYPRGVQNLVTNYETIVNANIGRALELSEYIHQSKLYHAIRAGVFLKAILKDVEKDVGTAKKVLSEIDRIQKGISLAGKQDVSYYANILRESVYELATKEVGKQIEPLFLTAGDVVNAVTNLKVLNEKDETGTALTIMLPFIIAYADLLTVVADVRKRSLRDIREALSAINWFREHIIKNLKLLNSKILEPYFNVSLNDSLLKDIGVNLSLLTVEKNLGDMVNVLLKLNSATYDALKGKTVELEPSYKRYADTIKRFMVEAGLVGKTDFTKAYFALKTFANFLAFEKYIYDSITKIVPDSEVASTATAKALDSYKKTVVDILISDLNDKAIRIGLAIAFTLPEAVAPVGQIKGANYIARISTAGSRIKDKLLSIIKKGVSYEGKRLSPANYVALRDIEEEGFKEFAGAIAFVKRNLADFFEQASIREIPKIIMFALRQVTLEALNELYSGKIQDEIAQKAKSPEQYYPFLVTEFHKRFSKILNRDISAVVRNSAITFAILEIYKELLEELRKAPESFVRTVTDALELLRRRLILFLDTKEQDIKLKLGSAIGDTYSMAITNLMISVLRVKDKRVVTAIKQIVPFFFLSPAMYVDFLKRHNIPFMLGENAIETTYNTLTDAFDVLKEKEIEPYTLLAAFLVSVFELFVATHNTEKKLMVGEFPLNKEAIILAIMLNFIPVVRLFNNYIYYISAGIFQEVKAEMIEAVKAEIEQELEEMREQLEKQEFRTEQIKELLKEQQNYKGFDGVFYFGSWRIE